MLDGLAYLLGVGAVQIYVNGGISFGFVCAYDPIVRQTKLSYWWLFKGVASISISDGSRKIKTELTWQGPSMLHQQNKPHTSAHSCPKLAGEVGLEFCELPLRSPGDCSPVDSSPEVKPRSTA